MPVAEPDNKQPQAQKSPSASSGEGSQRLVHKDSGVDVTDLRDEILAIRLGCEGIERGEIKQDFEFGHSSNFMHANARVELEFDCWLRDSRADAEFDSRCAVLRPIARAVEAVTRLMWQVWADLPNTENEKVGNGQRLPRDVARLKMVIGICARRLESLGS